MPIPTPMLDDRTYAQLRDELVRRIPVYNPEWTDHNKSDPGVTLLELFAFLGDTLLRRFNQIPETTLLAFLQLLQVPLRPAEPARGIVVFTPQGRFEDLARGVLLEVEDTHKPPKIVKAGAVPFEVTRSLRVWPVESLAMARVVRDETTADRSTPAARRLADLTEEARLVRLAARGGADEITPAYYVPTTLPADPSAPGAETLDLVRTLDGMVWVAVLAPKKKTVAEARELLFKGGGMKDATLTVGFIPDDDPRPDDPTPIDACPGTTPPTSAGSARENNLLVWEASTTTYRWQDEARTVPAPNPTDYRRLQVVGDTTSGFKRPGIVVLRLPRDIDALGVPDPGDDNLRGTDNLPPLLQDEEASGRVLFWLRARRGDGQSAVRVRWIGVNASEVEQRVTATPELLGTGNGQARQRTRLVHTPVIKGSLTLEVDESGDWQKWEEVAGFDASDEDDRHYTLDRESGEVVFGDGLQGRAPQIGARIRASRYQYGGGAAGNVPPKAITQAENAPGVKVSNPWYTRGGSADESLAAALERIPGEIRRRDRAVTASDFRELALMTPGVDIARADCLPFYRPSDPTQRFAGVVSVVVWPREDVKNPDAPTPDAGTRRAVCQWLDARRLVTTELYVLPPTYRAITVGLTVKTRDGYGVEAVHAWVERVLKQYLSPLPPYGPEGQGWPLGALVRAPALVAAVLQIEGVEYVEGLRVDDASGRALARTRPTELVALENWEVPRLRSVAVREFVEGSDNTPPETLPGLPEPEKTPIPIPVPSERC